MGRKHAVENDDVIVECAYELIKRGGFPSFSTRQLAAKLKISKTTAYNYLPSKEEIILRVVERGTKLYHQGLNSLIESRAYAVADLFDALLVAAEAMYFFVAENGDVFKLMFRNYNRYFEDGLTEIERIGFLRPIFARFFPQFESTEYSSFNTVDKLNRYYYISVTVFQLCVIDQNRTVKIDRQKFMEQICEVWSLLAKKEIPPWFNQRRSIG